MTLLSVLCGTACTSDKDLLSNYIPRYLYPDFVLKHHRSNVPWGLILTKIFAQSFGAMTSTFGDPRPAIVAIVHALDSFFAEV